MPEGLPNAPSSSPAPIRPRTAVAWCVVGVVVSLVLLLNFMIPDPAVEEFAQDLMTQQVQLQYGTRSFVESLGEAGTAGPAEAAAYEELAKSFARGPVGQRQRFAAVAGDMAGPSRALALLDETEALLRERKIPLEGKELAVQSILRKLYAGGGEKPDPGAPGRLTEEERGTLRKELRWFGELALAPPGSPGREAVLARARSVAGRQIAMILGALAILGLGVLGAVLFWLAVLRREGPFFLLGPGTAPHGIYAETFAAWMVLFMVMSLLAGLLVRFAGLGDHAMAVEGCAILLTLGALAWPVWRGVPFATVRDDLGLRLPANPVKEVLAGFACWLTSLPVMAAALVLVVALSFAAGLVGGAEDPLAPTNLPTHPIIGEVSRGGRWLLVLFLAAGVAPIVEETFFRGVLYRHLRDATGRKGRLVSVAISTAVSAFVFAVIHPQGLVAVPLLMAVAWGLVQAREWRGSLLAPMAAHSLHNAMVTLFLFLQFGNA